jgi:site-specific DNA-methyltransferase (adenine-specific)
MKQPDTADPAEPVIGNPDTSHVVRQEAVALLRSLEPTSAQVIIADPPYGIAYHSNHRVGKNPHAPVTNDWNFKIGAFLIAAGNVLKEGGVLYLFTRWDVYPLWSSLVAPPLTLKNVIVWNKDNHSAGDLRGDFGNKYEMLMMLTRGKFRRRGHRWSNVWEFPRVSAAAMLHPTQKPVALIQRAIEASSDLGDLVLDPFCGSGSTGVAALACGRRVLLGDVDPAMVRMSRVRLGEMEPEKEKASVEAPFVTECPIFGAVPPSPSLWGLHPEDLAHALGESAGK